MGLPVIVLMILSTGKANAGFGPPAEDCLRTLFRGVSGVVGYNCKVECANGASETTTVCYRNTGPFIPFSVFFPAGGPEGACTCFGKSVFMCAANDDPGFGQYGQPIFFGIFLKVHEVVTDNQNGGCQFKCRRCSDCCPPGPG